MEKLPEKWCIKATNDYEAKIIAEHANPLNMKYNEYVWSKKDSLMYYLQIRKGKYAGGSALLKTDCIEISFDDFQRLVLGIKNYNPNYEIY